MSRPIMDPSHAPIQRIPGASFLSYEVYKGSGGEDPRILNFGNGLRWDGNVSRFRCFIPGERPRPHQVDRLDEPLGRSPRGSKKFKIVPGIEPQPSLYRLILCLSSW